MNDIRYHISSGECGKGSMQNGTGTIDFLRGIVDLWPEVPTTTVTSTIFTSHSMVIVGEVTFHVSMYGSM